MRQCPVIQDLLPLYVDDALSPESRAVVDEHLAGCDACAAVLRSLQAGGPGLGAGLPGDAAAADDARFLLRLKRQGGTLIGILLVLLVGAAFAVSRYAQDAANRAYGEKQEQQIREERAAVEAFTKASPDGLARLKEHGVTLTYEPVLGDGRLLVKYHLAPGDGAVEKVTLMRSPWRPDARLYDATTGKELSRYVGGSGYLQFEPLSSLPGPAKVQFPPLFVYLRPESELRWQVERPGEEGDVLLGERFTVAGVEFEVERVRFSTGSVEIAYRQITDPAQVGLHFLSFRLSDRMGSTWGGASSWEHMPDPLRPVDRFEPISSFSQTWSIEVEHAVLAIPGPVIPVEVK